MDHAAREDTQAPNRPCGVAKDIVAIGTPKNQTGAIQVPMKVHGVYALTFTAKRPIVGPLAVVSSPALVAMILITSWVIFVTRLDLLTPAETRSLV